MHFPEDDEPTDPIPARKVNQVIAAQEAEASTDKIPAKTVTTLLAKGPKAKDERTDPDVHRASIDFEPHDHDPDETLRINVPKRR